MLLEDEADELAAVACAVGLAPDLLAVDQHVAAARLVEATDQVQQRAPLPDPEWPVVDGEHLARERVQRRVGERHDGSRSFG